MEFFIPYRDKKIECSIAFFAMAHKKHTGENLCQTALYKYLSFFDFRSLEQSGKLALGLTYKAMKYGPVPKEIYIDKQYRNSPLYNFEESKFSKNDQELTTVYITPNIHKDKKYLEVFSPFELELMNNLIFIFAQNWVTAKVMSDASHEGRNGIKAWVKTWKREKNDLIKFEDTFDDLENKINNNTASMPEEHFYIYQYLNA